MTFLDTVKTSDMTKVFVNYAANSRRMDTGSWDGVIPSLLVFFFLLPSFLVIVFDIFGL